MLAQLLKRSRHTVVLTGAGMSTESGLPDFRSSESGIWMKRNPLELATIHAMKQNRPEFISFYRSRIETLKEVRPHKGYDILAEWEKKGIIHAIITQNVDGFHSISGTQSVAELHGTLRSCHCNSCGRTYSSDYFVQSDELTCSCGGFIRPSVVLLGENLPEKALIFAEAESKKADLFIVLGSSLQVSPANLLPDLAKRKGARLVIVNMEPTPLDDIADLVIHNRKIGDVLQEADDQLRPHSVKKESILKVGAEGGSISIVKISYENTTYFYIERNESALADFVDDIELKEFLHTKGKLVHSFTEVLKHMDRYPWTRLRPILIHKDYKLQIKQALEARNVSLRVMEKWNKILYK